MVKVTLQWRNFDHATYLSYSMEPIPKEGRNILTSKALTVVQL